MAANGTVVLESSLKNRSCKKCKRTLINGVKCINCESYYHASCAESISEDSITCCESSVKTTSAPINEPATSRRVAGCAKIPEVTEKQLSCVLLETETRKKCNDYINLANHNEVAADDGEWKQVVKKKKRRQLVVGQNNSITINGKDVKGIPKMILLHVHRVDPTMTLKKLIEKEKCSDCDSCSLRREPVEIEGVGYWNNDAQFWQYLINELCVSNSRIRRSAPLPKEKQDQVDYDLAIREKIITTKIIEKVVR
ncbi:hypothetical protein JTB14_009318 [Gonioctena quinquepunctata]|nr:hypothetical protein JTB14_009318 [Gonioctena quinquepunctata]